MKEYTTKRKTIENLMILKTFQGFSTILKTFFVPEHVLCRKVTLPLPKNRFQKFETFLKLIFCRSQRYVSTYVTGTREKYWESLKSLENHQIFNCYPLRSTGGNNRLLPRKIMVLLSPIDRSIERNRPLGNDQWPVLMSSVNQSARNSPSKLRPFRATFLTHPYVGSDL